MVDAVKRHRDFPDAFKWEAIAAMRGGRSASQSAVEPGLPDRLVRSWLRWAEGRSPAVSGAPAPARRLGASPADQAAEITQLRKALDRARMERDILKRAALIFGRGRHGLGR